MAGKERGATFKEGCNCGDQSMTHGSLTENQQSRSELQHCHPRDSTVLLGNSVSDGLQGIQCSLLVKYAAVLLVLH